MTEKEIVRLAEEAELWAHKDREYAAIERFANLVAAAEREAIEQRIHKLDITLHTRLYVINHAIRNLTKEAEQDEKLRTRSTYYGNNP
jgi:hypothetical protein